MKKIPYPTRRRSRRETFPDGSQLVRRPGGSFEFTEARPKYQVGTTPDPSSPKPPAMKACIGDS